MMSNPTTANAPNLMMTPEPPNAKALRGLEALQQKQNEVPFETMLPAAEELKSMEIHSVGSTALLAGGKGKLSGKKSSVSKQRRSMPQAVENNEDLKSKVSRMMTNHSQLVEDLKA